MEKHTIDIYVTIRGGSHIEFCGLIDGDEEQELFGGGDHDIWNLVDHSEERILQEIVDYCLEYDLPMSVKKIYSPDYDVQLHIKQ